MFVVKNITSRHKKSQKCVLI